MTGYKMILFLIILPTEHNSNSVFLSSSSAPHVPATPRISSLPLWLENKTSNLTEFHFQEVFFFLISIIMGRLSHPIQGQNNIRSNALKRQWLTNALSLYEILKWFRGRAQIKALCFSQKTWLLLFCAREEMLF